MKLLAIIKKYLKIKQPYMYYKEDMQELVIILEPLVKLLRSAKEYSWSKSLHKYRVDCEYVENDHDADYIRQDILGMCRGAGSLSDLVLYSDGKYLPEHEEFKRLLSQLSSTIRKQKTKEHKER